MARRLIAAWLLLAAPLAHADCSDRAAARYRLDPDLLRAMAEQESYNRVDAVGPLLADGNRAIGKMGINTIHLPELQTYGVTRNDLLTECGSVFVGAWILARYVSLVGSVWDAVGAYNTGPKSNDKAAQARYKAAVRRRYERIRSARLQRERDLYAQQAQRVAGAMRVWGNE
jgi:soluble lytic murein transglycosylase-like protein